MRKFLVLLMALTLTAAPLFAMPKQVMTTTHRIEMIADMDVLGKIVKAHDICSATAIGPHALLTAKHCDLSASMVTIDGKEVSIVERIEDGSDHVIYMVDTNFSNYAEFSKGLPKLGSDVWLRGNPDGLTQLLRKGIYAGRITVQNEGVPMVVTMFNLDGWHGDSGSAIFDKHGRIVAVTSFGFTDGSFGMLGSLDLNFTSNQLAQAGRKSVYCLTA